MSLFETRKRASGSTCYLTKMPISEEDADKTLSSVVLTLCSGSSYDELYTSVPQEAPDGKVHVWVARGSVSELFNVLSGDDTTDTSIRQFLEDVSSDGVDVVVNFECCSNFSDRGFGMKDVISFTKLVLDKGWMIIFSDFSLKALISEWDPALLGPAPFCKLGEFGTEFELRFKPKVLRQCASTQLQTVGELCKTGRAVVAAMGGTIAFSLTSEAASSSNDSYEVEVLTVQTKWASGLESVPKSKSVSIGKKGSKHSGACGHVILTYPSGGQLLASSGHWVELSKLDVSKKAVMEAAKKRYGKAYCDNLKKEWASYATEGERQSAVQKYACEYVKKSAPCRKGGW